MSPNVRYTFCLAGASVVTGFLSRLRVWTTTLFQKVSGRLPQNGNEVPESRELTQVSSPLGDRTTLKKCFRTEKSSAAAPNHEERL